MPRAIRIHAQGGPEVMQWEEVAVGDPGPGEVRVRHTAVGVNYIDTYHRSGLYKIAAALGPGLRGRRHRRGDGIRRRLGEGGRSGRLLRRSARVLQRGARDARRPAGQGARRHLRSLGGDADAERASPSQYLFRQTLQAQGRRDDPVPRGGRRRGPHRLPVGARARRDDDRHRRLRREGGAREGERLHAHDRLHAREFRRSGEGADGRQGRAGRLRRHRQGHVSGVARLPVAARPLRLVRQRVGTGSPVRHPAAVGEGLALRARGRRSSPTRRSART